MSDKRSIINIDFSPIASVIMLAMVAIGFGIYFLVRGLASNAPAALVSLGVLLTLGLVGLGSLVTLAILWVGSKFVRGREAREQARFVENAKENLAILLATTKVQGTQNTMLLRQARDTQKMITSGNGDTVDADFLQIDDDVFAELE